MFGRISLQNLDTVLRHRRVQDELLHAMLVRPGISLGRLAKRLHWNKMKVYRVMQELGEDKFIRQKRDGHYVLTERGESEAAEIAKNDGTS
jgi:Mn-dependent DtxR family transcriptional regulator